MELRAFNRIPSYLIGYGELHAFIENKLLNEYIYW
jgi:hypothetical protein